MELHITKKLNRVPSTVRNVMQHSLKSTFDCKYFDSLMECIERYVKSRAIIECAIDI